MKQPQIVQVKKHTHFFSIFWNNKKDKEKLSEETAKGRV